MTQHRGSRPTIRDLAKDAGVSKSLVSLVLRGSDLVSEQKRADVLASARKLGYHPNLAARSLKSDPSRSDVVGLMVCDISQPWVSDVIAGVRPVLEEAGYRMLFSLLSPTAEGEPTDFTSLEVFRDLGVAGIIAVGSVPQVERMRELVLPDAFVFAGWSDPDGAFDAVRSDDERGMSLLVEHLAGNGHRRIAHAGGLGGVVAEDRLRGYRQTMRRLDLTDQMQVEPADFTVESGRRSALALLDVPQQSRPTAIACINDLAAMGAQQAATELGVDVAVTGYDDIEMAGLPAISLTTIDPDSREVGRSAAAAMLARLRGERERAGLELVAPSLVVRASTASAG